MLFSLAGCGSGGDSSSEQSKQTRKPQEIIEELVVDYGNYGDEASEHMQTLGKELKDADKNLGQRWEKIADIWTKVNTDTKLNYDVLPDGLPDTNQVSFFDF